VSLAIDGGRGIRAERLPIFRLQLTDEDVCSVESVLRSGQISRGSYPREFEAELAAYLGVSHTVVCSSGTAALHASLLALGIEPGSEVIVPALTFVATVLAPLYVGCRPIFAEVDPDTLTLDVSDVRRKISSRTAAVIGVDYGGQPCDASSLLEIARGSGCRLIIDAAHSIGAASGPGKVGAEADATAFSFFATKNLAAGEGGAVAVPDASTYERLQRIKAHGIQFPPGPRISGLCDVLELGHNFHLSNLNIALARSQLRQLDSRIAERKHLAAILTDLIHSRVDSRLVGTPAIVRDHAFHLYTVRLRLENLRVTRDQVIRALSAEGIETGVYYRPAHLFSYIRSRLGTAEGQLPRTEKICEELLTLPLYPGLSSADLEDISAALTKVLAAYAR
jgi:perosamine synthetase